MAGKARKSQTALAKAPALSPERVNQVWTWIIEGGSEHDIIEAISKEWKDAEAMPLILTAMQRIAKSANPETDALRGWCFEATRHVYQKAIEANDLPTALRAIKQLQGMTES